MPSGPWEDYQQAPQAAPQTLKPGELPPNAILTQDEPVQGGPWEDYAKPASKPEPAKLIPDTSTPLGEVTSEAGQKLVSAGKGAADVMSFGQVPKVQAALESVLNPADEDLGYSERYKKNLAENVAENEQLKQEHGGMYKAGQFLGFLLPGGAEMMFAKGAKGGEAIGKLAQGVSSPFWRGAIQRAGTIAGTAAGFGGYEAVRQGLGEGEQGPSLQGLAQGAKQGLVAGAKLGLWFMAPEAALESIKGIGKLGVAALPNSVSEPIKNMEDIIRVGGKDQAKLEQSLRDAASSVKDGVDGLKAQLTNEVSLGAEGLSQETGQLVDQLNGALESFSQNIGNKIAHGDVEALKSVVNDSGEISGMFQNLRKLNNKSYELATKPLEVKYSNSPNRIICNDLANETETALLENGVAVKNPDTGQLEISQAYGGNRAKFPVLVEKLNMLRKRGGVSIPEAMQLKRDFGKLGAWNSEATGVTRAFRDTAMKLRNKIMDILGGDIPGLEADQAEAGISEGLSPDQRMYAEANADYEQKAKIVDSVMKSSKTPQATEKLLWDAISEVPRAGQKVPQALEMLEPAQQLKVKNTLNYMKTVINDGIRGAKPRNAEAMAKGIRSQLKSALLKGDVTDMNNLDSLSKKLGVVEDFKNVENLARNVKGLPDIMNVALKSTPDLEAARPYIESLAPKSLPAYEQLLESRQALDKVQQAFPSTKESVVLSQLQKDGILSNEEQKSMEYVFDLVPEVRQAFEDARFVKMAQKAFPITQFQHIPMSQYGAVAAVAKFIVKAPSALAYMLYKTKTVKAFQVAQKLAEDASHIFHKVYGLQQAQGGQQ